MIDKHPGIMETYTSHDLSSIEKPRRRKITDFINGSICVETQANQKGGTTVGERK